MIRLLEKLAPLAENTRLFVDSLLPKRCPLCDAHGSPGFCISCQQLLPWITTGCEICGSELQQVGVCGHCQSIRPHYDHAVIPLRYSEPVSGQIQALKYHNQLQYASALGEMISRRVSKDPRPLPQVLIPVPLHRSRLRQRGFNQALEIARFVGKQLGVAVNRSSLERIRNTPSQTDLGESERIRNVKNAFNAVRPLDYVQVALVDDVVTSGSTVNAAARALKNAGVKTVSIWAIART